MQICVAIVTMVTLLAMAGPVVAAGHFEVAPTTLELQPGKAGMFFIANRGDSEMRVQIQPMDWQQQGGADQLSPSTTLIASPAVVKIKPNQRQIVRLLADAPADLLADGSEGHYRLIVSELPDAILRKDAVRVLLRFSIPVFVKPSQSKPPLLTWSARSEDGQVRLSARNDGPRTAKLTGMAVTTPDIKGHLLRQELTYLLPGGTMSWLMPQAPLKPVLHLVAREERAGRRIETEIPVLR